MPDMKKAPVPRNGWTTMTFSLINIDLAKTMQKLAAMAAASSPSSPPSEDVRAQILQGTRERLEERIVHCNPVIPQQLLTLSCAPFLLRKLDFITRLQWILLQHRAGLHSDFATEENLAEALSILEFKLFSDNGLLKQFAWTGKAYPQNQVTMYVLLHLCLKPEGPSVDRAWKAVDGFFDVEVQREITTGFGSTLTVLAALRAKAAALRDKVLNKRTGEDARAEDREPALVLGESSSQVASFQGDALDFGPDTTMDNWPDWVTLVQDFQLESLDVFLG